MNTRNVAAGSKKEDKSKTSFELPKSNKKSISYLSPIESPTPNRKLKSLSQPDLMNPMHLSPHGSNRLSLTSDMKSSHIRTSSETSKEYSSESPDI